MRGWTRQPCRNRDDLVLTWVYRAVVVLEDGDGADAGNQGDPDQLQADVQPLHGGVAYEQAALVVVQAPHALLLKPAVQNTSESNQPISFRDGQGIPGPIAALVHPWWEGPSSVSLRVSSLWVHCLFYISFCVGLQPIYVVDK